MRTRCPDANSALTAPVGPIGTSSLFGAAPRRSALTRPTADLSPSRQGGWIEKPAANRLYVAKETIGPLALAGTRLRRVLVTVKSGDWTPSIHGRRLVSHRRNQPTQGSECERFALWRFQLGPSEKSRRSGPSEMAQKASQKAATDRHPLPFLWNSYLKLCFRLAGQPSGQPNNAGSLPTRFPGEPFNHLSGLRKSAFFGRELLITRAFDGLPDESGSSEYSTLGGLVSPDWVAVTA